MTAREKNILEILETDLSWTDAAQEILERLLKARSVWITGHERPDIDCYGAQLALAGALSAGGVEVRIGNSDPIPGKYLEISSGCEYSRWDGVESLEEWDEIILLDASFPKRAGKIETASGWHEPMIIDHHIPPPEPYGRPAWVLSDAAATSEMLYLFLLKMGRLPDAEAAQALLAGIMFDTGNFCYSNTRAVTLEIAAELLRLGASPIKFYRMQYQNRSDGEMRLEAIARSRLRKLLGGKIGVIRLEAADFEQTGTGAEQIMEFPRITREPAGGVIGVLVSEIEQGMTKVSLRSDGSVDVAEVAAFFGGGGHRRAAACRFTGIAPEEAERRVMEKLAEYFDQ